MLTHAQFRSNAFPAYESEEEEVNPGVFGKRLADYLGPELARRGESVEEPFAEDWGWVIPIVNAGFNLWIGVGNYEGRADTFLCFIEPHTDEVRWWFRKVPTREPIESLQAKLDAALRAHAEIRELRWSTYEEFAAPTR